MNLLYRSVYKYLEHYSYRYLKSLAPNFSHNSRDLHSDQFKTRPNNTKGKHHDRTAASSNAVFQRCEKSYLYGFL